MKVTFTGKNMQVRDELREVVVEKLSKYNKFFNTTLEADVTFSHQGKTQTVEVTIPLKNHVVFRAEAHSDNMLTSIDRVVDRLNKQISKHKTKIEKVYRSNDSIKFSEIPTHEEPSDSKIVKSKTFAMKPMDPEEAVLQMELIGHSFYVFRNGKTDDVNVVYQRKDGNYGLIEPQI